MRPKRSADPPPVVAGSPALRRLLRNAALFAFGLGIGFLGPYLWAVDRWLQGEFGRLSWQIPTRVYARPLPLKVGIPLTASALEVELAASGFRREVGAPTAGSFDRDGQLFLISTRGFRDLDRYWSMLRLRLRLADGEIATLARDDGRALDEARLDPARIANFYGDSIEERRLVRLQDVPPLLIATLQTVEDREFKHHPGVDWRGIARALWANLRAGEVRQGGSTLTQQLARNLYLNRAQSVRRKLREALYALLIEARFSKPHILEVYLNHVYLGQAGNQAVHGVAAGAEFWFGRELDQLGPADIALLVGMIRGPAQYDPRKNPQLALERRNRVLEQLVETGVLAADQVVKLRAQPLRVSAAGSLNANRYPAFIALARDQLTRDYAAKDLEGAGLSVLTTLDPQAQQAAERAVKEQLAELQKGRAVPLQASLVLTDTHSGEVRALIGGADPRDSGFNRALDAQRPVGSLLKPFVYLLALAQPGRFSLAARVEDMPITVRTTATQTWSPGNIDNISHGEVALIDALAQSYNQATVRIGMAVGVERLSRLIQELGVQPPPAHPSLLLGAADLSPYQMTQLYQFLASGGELQPLRAVRGVLGAQGKPLSRYDRPPAAADPGDAIAARLVTLALQRAVSHGTGRRLLADGFSKLAPAGKTGTSNDGRDSWFAGWSGDQLAVVWVGDDHNRATGLFGATGALRVWSALFHALPTRPLYISDRGIEWAWVAADAPVTTDPDCEGARQLAFVAGFAPVEHRSCRLERLRDWFER